MQERGLVTLSESVMAEAKRRADIICPLARQTTIDVDAVDQAAVQLGISRRQVYKLLVKIYRNGAGLVTDLAPGQSSGGVNFRRGCHKRSGNDGTCDIEC